MILIQTEKAITPSLCWMYNSVACNNMKKIDPKLHSFANDHDATAIPIQVEKNNNTFTVLDVQPVSYTHLTLPTMAVV